MTQTSIRLAFALAPTASARISLRSPHLSVRRPTLISPVRCMASDTKMDKSTPDSKWKEVLSAEEYYVLRQKGTEPPRTGEYDKHFEEGTYNCRACGTPLYTSNSKFNSGCGWPAFDQEIPGAVERHTDNSLGMQRTEITCANCGGHLGHEFVGERFTDTNSRHCVNSISIKFVKKA